MKKTLISMLILSSLAATALYASSDDHYKRRMSSKDIFEMLDQNEDGKISLAEYVGFTKLDKDNDGLLTYDEFKNERRRFTKSHDDDDHDDDHHKFKFWRR